MQQLLSVEADLWTHNYVVLETTAVMQRKLGLHPTLLFLSELSDIATVRWVLPDIHDQAIEILTDRNVRTLSLVDCISFVLMENYGSTTAFGFDSDFLSEGFELL